MAKENIFIILLVCKYEEITSVQMWAIFLSLLEKFREGKEKEINNMYKMGLISPVLTGVELEYVVFLNFYKLRHNSCIISNTVYRKAAN